MLNDYVGENTLNVKRGRLGTLKLGCQIFREMVDFEYRHKTIKQNLSLHLNKSSLKNFKLKCSSKSSHKNSISKWNVQVEITN